MYIKVRVTAGEREKIKCMYIKVRVTAGAKKEKFEKKSEDHFNVWVKEPAERNLANTRVRELLAGHFIVSIGKVKLVSGHHSPSKILDIRIED